jgi:serine protease Do
MNILQQFSDDLAAVSDNVLRSLVQVRNGSRGGGAGIIWASDGLILTNQHVVEGQRGGHNGRATLSVVLGDGRTLPARLIATAPQHDLAALRIEAHGLTPVVLGDSQQLQAGELVLALGFPWGVTGGATLGAIISMDGQWQEASDRQGAAQQPSSRAREWLTASLHLRPGHSGGPMVDAQGRLVGINTMMNGPDVGVAIPVHVAKAFLSQAMAAASLPTSGIVMV